MHILITGASKGIGLAIAQRFASTEDIRLSLCSRDENDINDTKRQLAASAPQTLIVAASCDVSRSDEVKRFVNQSLAEHGPVDVLINNAGFGLFQSVLEMRVEDFDRVLAANLRGVFLMTQSVLPQMKARRSGTIVTIASVAGKQGFKRGGAYCSSKFGVRGLMQSLSLEVREENIRVITVFPGNVDTGFFASAGIDADTSQYLRPEDVAEIIYRAVTLSDSATTTEVDIRPTNPKIRA